MGWVRPGAPRVDYGTVTMVQQSHGTSTVPAAGCSRARSEFAKYNPARPMAQASGSPQYRYI